MKIQTVTSMTIEFTNKELAEALKMYATEKIKKQFGNFEAFGITPHLKAVARGGDDSACLEVTITDTE